MLIREVQNKLVHFQPYWKYIIVLILLYQPIFGHLGVLPMRVWDEARLAINAMEMMETGQIMVTQYQGEPDLWNTKPPLLIWLQAISMSIFGINEVAFRLPSAIAALLTCLFLLYFFRKQLDIPWLGVISVLILINSAGYVSIHGIRTGDYDAMLTLFTLLANMSFYMMIEKNRSIHVYAFFIFLSLAILTKSVAALLFVPGYLLYALLRNGLKKMFLSKHFYLGAIIAMISIVGYYLTREIINPGYLAAVQHNELGGRFLEFIGTEKEIQFGFWFYFDNFIHTRFSPWMLFIIPGILLSIFHKEETISKIGIFSTIMAVCHFFVISNSKSKLEWYDLPSYPYLAIIAAISVHFIFDFLRHQVWMKNNLRYNVAPLCLLIMLFSKPYLKTIDNTYKPVEDEWGKEYYEITYLLRDLTLGKKELKNTHVLYDGYYAHNLFYVKKLNHEGKDIAIKHFKEIHEDDQLLVCQAHMKKYIEDKFDFKIINSFGNIDVVKLITLKSNAQ